MSRISLVGDYDNKDVIQQIKNLKDDSKATADKADKASQDADNALSAISGAVADASEALALARPAKENADQALLDAATAQGAADDARNTADLNARNVTVTTDNVSGTVIVTTPTGTTTQKLSGWGSV